MTELQAVEMLQKLDNITVFNQLTTGLISGLIGVTIACAIVLVLGVWLRDI